MDSQSAKFLLSLIDHLPLALFCKDYENEVGQFIAWNKRAEILWGLKKEEVIGKSDYDFFPKDQADYFKEIDHQTLRAKITHHIAEEAVDSPTVGRRFVQTWKMPILDDRGRARFLLGVSEDITEKVNLKSELEQQRLKTLNSAKMASLGEMAGGIAHEINNPLTIIQGHINLIERMVISPPVEPKKLLSQTEKINRTIFRIKSIIDGLRLFSRDGSNDSFDLISTQNLIEDSLIFCKERFKRSNISLDYKNQNPDANIECRRVQISQVIVNLLNNARKVAEQSQAKWITLSVEDLGSFIKISVIDPGLGISKEVKEKLFTPFFTTKPVGQGTGLGLSISKGIIEVHGGKIYLDEAQKNTTFVVELPKAQPAKKKSS